MKIPKTLEKLPDEQRVYAFDFSKQPEITEGNQVLQDPAVITATPDDSADPDGLDIDTPVIDNVTHTVRASYSKGKAGTTYQIECVVPTDGSAILGMFGNLSIVDPDDLKV